MKKYYLFLLLIILISPSIFGLLHKGFFISDDGNWMVIRFSAFYEALRGGQIPVRFLPRLYFGLGYPVADFLYPLFMYVGLPIKLIGFSFVNTIKIIFGVSMILSGIFSFCWLKKFFKHSDLSAIIGAVTYVLFPYHLWDVYKRGSIGEILALSIVPFILWQIEQQSLFLTSIGIGLLIVSHNTLALLFLPIVVVYSLFRKKMSLSQQVISVFIGLGLSAFFWIPALYDKQFTVFDKTIVSDFANYFNWNQALSLISIITLACFMGGVYLLFKKRSNMLILFFSLLILSLFFASPLSKPLWEILPGANLIQFPFRFLSITILAVSFITSFIVETISKNYRFIFSVALLVIALFSALPFLYPKNFEYQPDGFFSTNMDSTTVMNEYLPIWANVKKRPVPNIFTMSSQHIEVQNGRGEINESSRGTNIQAKINLFYKTTVQLDFLYFPGWEVKIDGKSVPLNYKQSGLITFQVPRGDHIIEAKFKETRFRLLADFLSVLSFLGLMVFGFTKKRYV